MWDIPHTNTAQWLPSQPWKPTNAVSWFSSGQCHTGRVREQATDAASSSHASRRRLPLAHKVGGAALDATVAVWNDEPVQCVLGLQTSLAIRRSSRSCLTFWGRIMTDLNQARRWCLFSGGLCALPRGSGVRVWARRPRESVLDEVQIVGG